MSNGLKIASRESPSGRMLMVLFSNCGCVVSPATVSSMTGKIGCFDFFLHDSNWNPEAPSDWCGPFRPHAGNAPCLPVLPVFCVWSRFLQTFRWNLQWSIQQDPRVLRKLWISWVKILSWRRSFIIVSRSLRRRLDKVRMMERSA